mmetsp:Transcript_44075/g.79289  ORF Transcript_44075/g.79289 Transcript_44075/m.79289 type:complete len:289 (+) Transcript_44075:62-928(+)
MAPKSRPKAKTQSTQVKEHPSPDVAATLLSVEHQQGEKCASLSYPRTISLDDLNDALRSAYWLKQPVLVCASGRHEVESYLSYQTVSMFDCKRAAVEVAITKEKTLEQARCEFRRALVTAIRGNPASGEGCFPRPFWLRFGNNAFTLANFCDADDSLVARVLRKGYTAEDAFVDGLISESEKRDLENSDRFRENFGVVLTSDFGAEEAREHLRDSVPNFDDLGLIIVEPAPTSVAKAVKVDSLLPKPRASMYEDLPEALQAQIQEALVSGNQEELAAVLKVARNLHRC